MPMAARVTSLTGHGTPLTPGPGCPTVLIGGFPAWRALPEGMGSAVESISNLMNSFMVRPQMTPADGTASLVQISQSLAQGGAAAARAGAPAAAATAGSMVATLNATNVTLTATWTAASAVPGGQPAANIAYTEGIKAAAAAAATAVMASMAGLSDIHICPIPVPLPPHGPGFVTAGSSTVVIGKLAATRQGDQVFEACGGPDPIAMGFPTVWIGGIVWKKQPGATDEDLAKAKQMWEDAKKRRLPDGSKPDTVKAMEALESSFKRPVIMVGPEGNFEAPDNEADGMNPTKGTNPTISFNPNKTDNYSDGTPRDPESSFAHEAVHGYQDTQGTTPPTQQEQEVSAATAENQHRKAKGLPQRRKYGNQWDIPQF